MIVRVIRLGAVCMLAVVAIGCAGGHPDPGPPLPAAPLERVVQRLFLIGDAGEPDPAGEPVLMALERDVRSQASPAMIVFLGDNIYPDGMPAAGAADRDQAEQRLQAQMDVALESGARGLFVPGNHDWHGDGLDQVRRQGAYITEHGGDLVAHVPEAGCPGPRTIDLGSRLRLVALDTQWWLHGGLRPEGEDSGCEAGSEADVRRLLAAALDSAGDRDVIVIAHHPLLSGGPHGGHFTWKDHLFPLTKLAGWAWVPLPGIGSIYPLWRKFGGTTQDLASSKYEHMLDVIEDVLAEFAPLAYAAGHEHSLQVLGGDSARYVLVSGCGYYGNEEPIGTRDETLYAGAAAGYMRLDVPEQGPARLAVLVVDAGGGAREAFSQYLE